MSLPRGQVQGLAKAQAELPRSPGHFTEWVDAIKTGQPSKAMSNFDIRRSLDGNRSPRRRRSQGRHHDRVGRGGHEGEKRSVRRSIHSAAITARGSRSTEIVARSLEPIEQTRSDNDRNCDSATASSAEVPARSATFPRKRDVVGKFNSSGLKPAWQQNFALSFLKWQSPLRLPKSLPRYSASVIDGGKSFSIAIFV